MAAGGIDERHMRWFRIFAQSGICDHGRHHFAQLDDDAAHCTWGAKRAELRGDCIRHQGDRGQVRSVLDRVVSETAR